MTSVSDLPVKLCNLKTFGVALFSKAEAEVVFPDEIKEEVIDAFNNCFKGIKSVFILFFVEETGKFGV